MRGQLLKILCLVSCGLCPALLWGQRVQFPPSNGLRPIQSNGVPATTSPVMVPINPATGSGIYPTTPGTQTFDPYSTNPYAGGVAPTNQVLPGNSFAAPPPTYGGNASVPPSLPGGYGGVQPALPGAAPSGVVGNFPSNPATINQPGVYPNGAPAALYPGGGNPNAFGDFFSSTYDTVFGDATVANVYSSAPGTYPPPITPSAVPTAQGWNPQGAVITPTASPPFIRLFQGVRFRHGYVFASDDPDSLAINDTDVSLAVVFPNFLWSTQPIFVMPSFSLHQWSGPKTIAPITADLPAIAYSAFLDTGWQSDPQRIFGGELGLRVGMFSDFNANSSDSLRVMGRGIGRIRITPRTTFKLGVLYLDRIDTKLLPAVGLLWEPNPQTRFDLFFPEPKLSHYLSTVGTTDTWWYVGGYYGGGNWTIQRPNKPDDRVDINDIRLVLGVEWGRNELIKAGRRFGFFEVGFLFDRNLVYYNAPQDNLKLEDSLMLRVGFGY